MEIKKKLTAPSGNVHDIKYLYVVIASLKHKGGRGESNTKTLQYFKKAISNYNYSKASKYGLSFRPREVNTDVVKHIVAELKHLELIREEEGYLILTSEGENVASLIEKKDSKELKILFTELMLESSSIFECFLKRIREVSNGDGVPIPFITSGAFDKCGGDPKKIAENYINMINRHCSGFTIEPERFDDLLEDADADSIEKRTDRIDKLQTVIEKFVVSGAFGPNIKSRRAYDFVRSRTTFLGLTNYAICDFDGFPAEVTYSTSDFEPTFNHSTKKVDFSGGSVYINYPTFEEIQELFEESITRVYNTSKDDFEYMKIADARDMVCRELRIYDDLFDEYLKKLYKEKPHWLSFTYSGWRDKITEKRLPIIFERPMREFFTLLKINPGR